MHQQDPYGATTHLMVMAKSASAMNRCTIVLFMLNTSLLACFEFHANSFIIWYVARKINVTRTDLIAFT